MITIFAALLALSAVLVSCGSSAPEGMVALEGDNTTYNIYVPETWAAALSGGAVSAYAEDMSNISVQTVAIPKNDAGERLYEDLNDFCENGLKMSISSSFSDIKYAETSEDALGGEKALTISYIVTVFDVSAKTSKEYTVMQTVTERRDNFYILTYTAESANYSKHTDEVKSVVSNFSFK